MASANDKLLKAIELQNQGKDDEAARLFRKILSSDPNNAGALYSLSVIALHDGNHTEALRLSKQGIKAAPLFAPMRFVHGAALQAAGRKEEAVKSYDEALEIDPNAVDVLLNSGVLLRDMHRHHEALERFNRIVGIDPNNASGLGNCAILLTEFKQSEQAIAMFERLLQIKPDYDYGLGLLAYERLHVCDWTGFEETSRQIIEGVRAGQRTCKSLAFMAISDSASDHLIAARTFAEHFCPRKPVSLWQGERYQHDKIRLAYVSPDLREHPVGHLIAGVFEHHDKSRFETIAISLGIDDQSRIRARMLKVFDRFIDARDMGASQIAQLMRDLEVDIAVDLGGYTSDTRTDIFAHRPAPVQINYLGYPGTMGTDYYDYILADHHVIPEEHRQFYSEKVAYLPDTYLPTDGSVQISERTPTRAECDLPETGFIFCSFSHDYKISPPLFDVWMRLLWKVPGSVLWLMSRGEVAQNNLRKEAAARGVDPARLVFANRVPRVEDHLARYRQANLFLDTHPYNAHTTAADALMAGLPVLTYMGNAFPARVAGSLLQAIGLPELITHSLADYEALALKLATTPSLLADMKSRLRVNKETSPLFDTERFCRNLESAFEAMCGKALVEEALGAEQVKKLQEEFGLSYHIEYAALAERLVGFTGKRVLEVGGSLPERLVLDRLRAAQWTALEEMEYWAETLSTGHVLGTPPAESGSKLRFSDVTPSAMQPYNLFYGRIEELPTALESQFDLVFSIAAFEHIARLPLALEKMRRALKPGGKLFTLFAPIWSSYNGHHLPEVVDRAGKHWSFGNSPVPPWGHLIFRPAELLDLLSEKCDVETAREIVYFVYSSPHINRFFLDDYLEIVSRSGFGILQATPVFEMQVPESVQQQLEARYPGRRDFGHNGLLLVLEQRGLT